MERPLLFRYNGKAAFASTGGSALVLFATGRFVGWVAHAAEQYAAEEPIRPRATYVGPRPSESGSPGDAL